MLKGADAYSFTFYPMEFEGWAYDFMLRMQERDSREIVAYLAINLDSDSKGVLVLPWYTNSESYSDPLIGLNVKEGIIETNSGTAYKVTALIHTHTKTTIPSPADMETTKNLGLPHFILHPKVFLKIDLNLQRNQQIDLGPTFWLLEGDDSLFNY